MFTWMESVFVAEITASFEVIGVLISMFALVIIPGSLFAAALFTKLNVNILLNLSIAVFFAAILQMILFIVVFLIGFENWWVAGYAVFGVILTGFYILIDLI